MNKLNRELEAFFGAFLSGVGLGSGQSLAGKVDILIAAPATLLDRAVQLARPHQIRIAAQNIHWEPSGAYTGEVSIPMICEVGATASLIGHSERRQYFAESDSSVAKKALAALGSGVLPIVCIGETLAERDAGQMEAVVTRQVKALLEVVRDPKDLIFAYEPVWAIGTGRSATSAQAQEAHALIRSLVAGGYGSERAGAMRILYGGSANAANIQDLLAQPDIDGALVGGASLKPDEFAKMVRAAL